MCPPNFYSILHGLLDDLLCLIVDHPLNGMATFPYPLDSGLFGTCFVSAAIGLCVDQGSAFIPLFSPKTVITKITDFCVGNKQAGAQLHRLPEQA